MKNLYASLLAFAFLCVCAYAQERKVTEFDHTINLNIAGFNEKILRAKMKNDGLSQPMIDKIIAEKILWEMRNDITSSTSKQSYVPPVPNAGTCDDMGVENGWGSWTAYSGTANSGSQTWNPPSTPASPQFNLSTGAGVDPCTPATTPPNAPPIQNVSPGFGNTSIQMGQQQTAGCGAEKLTYSFTVQPGDTNFIFSYALVIQDAGHSASDQPFVDFCLKDQNGNNIPCGCFRYTGGPNLPGFYTATCGFQTYYKPWTIVGVNLSAYVGQTITATILNVDCAQCGHFAHSYWDFTCKPLSSSMSSFCLGQPASLCAPSDPSINYQYSWTLNGNPYGGPPSATAQCITPTPNVGDTFVVTVSHPSPPTCPFRLTYVPTPMTVTPNFNYTVQCGTVTFTDSSVTSNGSPITGWNWTFPSGNPATSTSQNPTATFPAGNYSVTLVVSTQAGCTDTIIKPVNVNGLPTAAFSVNTVCAGSTTTFADNSIAGVGDPIVSWNWSFPGGNPATSTSQNPSVTFPAGNYVATLTVTSQGGCTATVTQSVTVNPLPVASITGPNVCFNNVTQFADLSTGNNTITSWNWTMTGGNPASSISQNPSTTFGSSGTFSVSVVITNNFGCKDSTTINVIVNPLPMANFTLTPVCFGDSTCFQDQSSVTPGNVTGWSWNFGDPNSGPSNIANTQNPCHTFTGQGPYTVILTCTSDSGCQSTTQHPATVNPLPTANFTSSPVCLNVSTNFTDGSTPTPISTWAWDFGDPASGNNTSVNQNPSHVFSAAGNYTVSLIITDANGCKDTVYNPVTVYQLPTALFNDQDSGCAPVCHSYQDLSVANSGNIATWMWSFPGGYPSSASTANPGPICYPNPGSYGASLVVTTNYGCKDSIQLNNIINVFDWPKADFCVAPDKASVNDPTFTFCPLWSSDVTQWIWNFGDATTDNSATNPVHSYSAIATNNDFYTYEICVNVQNQHGCYDSICHTIELQPEFEFYIPNCVTPNNDGTNDFFFGKSRGVKEYDIWVFDRWGNLIWDCHYEGKNTDWDNNKQNGMSSACQWDAKVEGGASNQIVQEDVYVWKVRLTDIFDKIHNYIGHVSVVK